MNNIQGRLPEKPIRPNIAGRVAKKVHCLAQNCDDCLLRLFFPTAFCKSYLNQLVQLAWAASEKSKMNKSSLYTI